MAGWLKTVADETLTRLTQDSEAMEKEMASRVEGIAMTNVWNRLNVTTKVAGEWAKSAKAQALVKSGAVSRRPRPISEWIWMQRASYW